MKNDRIVKSMKILVLWGCCSLLFGTAVMAQEAAATAVGVVYRGHVQDYGDQPAGEAWVTGDAQLGTTGESKRIEGFRIKLTGTEKLPAGAGIRYNVHVQNVGWLADTDLAQTGTWVADGDFAGSQSKSQRVEAIQIVLTGADGKALPGYSVQYQVHIQDYGWSQGWQADGAIAGTSGESKRLEAVQIKIVKTETDPAADESVVYDKAGTNGPATGSETIAGDVTVAADGVMLQNLVIEGNLSISEAVGDGNVTLNNVTVAGDTFVRGGGVNSIHINGGSYKTISVENTPTGAVRIVAIGVNGLAVVIAEDASGETVILEGDFDSVAVNAPHLTVTTQGDTTTIGTMTVGTGAGGTTLNLASGTTVTDLVLAAKTSVTGPGTVKAAAVAADGVSFEKAPEQQTVAPEVTVPPVVTPVVPPTPGGGGSYTPPVLVTGISLDQTTLAVEINRAAQLTATLEPANATIKTVTWISSDATIATVDASGKVTGIKEGGPVTITATSANGKTASCAVTVTPVTVTGVTLNSATRAVEVSKATQLMATVAPADAANQAVNWTSSDDQTATVDATGKVTGIKVGTATITATTVDGGKTASCAVTVNPLGVTGVSLNSTTLALYVSDSASLTATIAPTNAANQNLTWTSAKPDIANVDGSGMVTGIKAGTTVITVTTADGGFSASCTVTVTNLFIVDAATGTITGMNDSRANIEIPAAVDGVPITAIGNHAFEYDNLASIIIPNTVTAIGTQAFFQCQNLNTVTFAADSKLTTIGANAFNSAGLRTSLTLPDSVTSIGQGAFSNSALKTIGLPAGLTAISDNMFKSCASLTKVVLPTTVQTIGNSAFSGCTGLTEIAIPDGVTVIPDSAFDGCWALASVQLPSGLTTIGTNGFYRCEALKSITLPASLETIGQQAFDEAGTVDDPNRIITKLKITFAGNAPTLATGIGLNFAKGTTIQYYAGCTGFAGVQPWKDPSMYTLVELNAQPITNTAISGVTIPFNGDTPVTAITADPQYTGTVSWTETISGTPVTNFMAWLFVRADSGGAHRSVTVWYNSQYNDAKLGSGTRGQRLSDFLWSDSRCHHNPSGNVIRPLLYNHRLNSSNNLLFQSDRR